MAKKKEKTIDYTAKLLDLFIRQPLLWGMQYLPHHFRDESPGFHLKILDFAQKNRFFAVASPRESAKSTIVALLYPLHSIVFKKKRFILIVSNTYKKACGSLDSIKQEIKDNKDLRDFVKIEVSKDAEGDSILKHKDGFSTRILCKGAEQLGSVRGEKFGAYRPDLIIVDDLEDDEMVKNPERREDLQKQFDEALLPAGDIHTSQVLAIGTILHDDALIAKLVSLDYYPKWEKLIYQARWKNPKTAELESLWPQKWTVDWLNELEKNNPEKFAKEYQNNPVSGMMRKFKSEDFRRWAIIDNQAVLYNREGKIKAKYDLKDCKGAISCDLAWETKRQSDYSVIMPGFLTPDSELLIDTYIMKKGLRPNEMEAILFPMEERLRKLTGGSIPIGFEKAKLEKIMQWLLKQAMKKNNQYLMFKPLEWDKDKITRIVTRLQPRYAQHSIYHRQGMGDLEHQLIRVPSGMHDDLPDAEQGLVQLLQTPKPKAKEKKQDNMFMRLRKFAIDSKKPRQYSFNSQRGVLSIPAEVSPIG